MPGGGGGRDVGVFVRERERVCRCEGDRLGREEMEREELVFTSSVMAISGHDDA